MIKTTKYPDKFNSKREILWYIRGLKDAKILSKNIIELEEKRYLESINFMDFDKNGNVVTVKNIQPKR